MYKTFIFMTLLSSSIIAAQAANQENIKLKNYRENPAMWDMELLKEDMENMPITDTLVTGAFPIGVFPVPVYDSIKKDFNGVGNFSNYEGIKINNKTIVYNSFYYSLKNSISPVFFVIIALTDNIDLENYTHATDLIYSRNYPYYTGQGNIYTKKSKISYFAFSEGNSENFAVVNMRLFNLKYGKIILIAPQKDGTLRSKQIDFPDLTKSNLKETIETRILKQKDIMDFFLDKNNI